MPSDGGGARASGATVGWERKEARHRSGSSSRHRHRSESSRRRRRRSESRYPRSTAQVDLQQPPLLEADPQPPPPLEVDPARNRRTRGRPATTAVSAPPPEVDPQPLCSRTEGTHTQRMVREEIGMNRGRIKIRTHTSGTTVCR
jgi:hypothetical protein